MNYDKVVVRYVEPDADGNAVEVRIPAREAIERSRKFAETVGTIFNFPMSDEQLLSDFIVVHWASLEFGDD